MTKNIKDILKENNLTEYGFCRRFKDGDTSLSHILIEIFSNDKTMREWNELFQDFMDGLFDEDGKRYHESRIKNDV